MKQKSIFHTLYKMWGINAIINISFAFIFREWGWLNCAIQTSIMTIIFYNLNNDNNLLYKEKPVALMEEKIDGGLKKMTIRVIPEIIRELYENSIILNISRGREFDRLINKRTKLVKKLMKYYKKEV